MSFGLVEVTVECTYLVLQRTSNYRPTNEAIWMHHRARFAIIRILIDIPVKIKNTFKTKFECNRRTFELNVQTI